MKEGVVITRTVLAVGVFVSACTTAVFADPIQLQSSRDILGHVSFTFVDGLNFVDFFNQEVADLGPFSTHRTAGDALAFVEASQNTTVTTDRFAGSGTASAHATGPFFGFDVNRAQSELAVQFTLSRTLPYRFTGVLSAADDGFAFAGLDGEFFDGSRPQTTLRVEHSGVLMPGQYRFFTNAWATGGDLTYSGEASFNVDFALGSAATPEPPTLLLLAIGSIAAATYCRRLKHFLREV
jgi:hypothetical protein